MSSYILHTAICEKNMFSNINTYKVGKRRVIDLHAHYGILLAFGISRQMMWAGGRHGFSSPYLLARNVISSA